MKTSRFQALLPIILCVVSCGSVFCKASKVQMRIVRETANYGYFGNNLGDVDSLSKLVARVQPADFSGPSLLKKLLGKCFNVTLERYRYVFCPFQNVTQHEMSSRWNSYQGVLGVWSHWKIENNSFVSMIFTHGAECGDVERTVEVYLQCGVKDHLLNVSEPERCQYHAVFQTRLVCHEDSVLVYPRLSREYQQKWDHLWTDFKRGHLTEKGYNKALQKMFYEIGFVKPPEEKKKEEEKSTEFPFSRSSNTFTDLSTCNAEYEKIKKEVLQLNEEIDSLKLMLDINKIRNRTVKHPKS